jgi:hypothetical protein
MMVFNPQQSTGLGTPDSEHEIVTVFVKAPKLEDLSTRGRIRTLF